MKPFEYAAPQTLKEATELLSDKWGETEIMAGGTDLVTSLKQHITEPKRVVSLRNIPEPIENNQREFGIGFYRQRTVKRIKIYHVKTEKRYCGHFRTTSRSARNRSGRSGRKRDFFKGCA